MNRPGDAQEVAAGVSFLASAAAGYITGVVLPIDGGYLVG
jgi:3-oxoacyl-[acyl-carrier protein] reductase